MSSSRMLIVLDNQWETCTYYCFIICQYFVPLCSPKMLLLAAGEGHMRHIACHGTELTVSRDLFPGCKESLLNSCREDWKQQLRGWCVSFFMSMKHQDRNYVKIPISRAFYLVTLAFTLCFCDLWLLINVFDVDLILFLLLQQFLHCLYQFCPGPDSSWFLWGWVWFMPFLMKGWQPIVGGDSEHEQVLEVPSGLWQLSCY